MSVIVQDNNSYIFSLYDRSKYVAVNGIVEYH